MYEYVLPHFFVKMRRNILYKCVEIVGKIILIKFFSLPTIPECMVIFLVSPFAFIATADEENKELESFLAALVSGGHVSSDVIHV
jgi:hypothetical protein